MNRERTRPRHEAKANGRIQKLALGPFPDGAWASFEPAKALVRGLSLPLPPSFRGETGFSLGYVASALAQVTPDTM